MSNGMNQEVKQRWVEALRSGKYEQGTGTLNKNDRFCCLGVLCDILADETGTERKLSIEKGATYDTKRVQYDGNSALPPGQIMIYAFKSGHVPSVTIDGKVGPLQRHNDTYGATFEQIADAIEEQL